MTNTDATYHVILQATTFAMFGVKSTRRGQWPEYTAIVYDEDGSEFSRRTSSNDCDIARWLESFALISAEAYYVGSCN